MISLIDLTDVMESIDPSRDGGAAEAPVRGASGAGSGMEASEIVDWLLVNISSTSSLDCMDTSVAAEEAEPVRRCDIVASAIVVSGKDDAWRSQQRTRSEYVTR